MGTWLSGLSDMQLLAVCIPAFALGWLLPSLVYALWLWRRGEL